MTLKTSTMHLRTQKLWNPKVVICSITWGKSGLICSITWGKFGSHGNPPKISGADGVKSKTSPYYLSTNFQILNENENRIVTRTTANNFFKPRICTNMFAYSAICEWNKLSSNINNIKGEKKIRDLNMYILEAEKKREKSYVYLNSYVYLSLILIKL